MDNFFKECPARMSDGRIFSDYKTSTRRNEYIKYANGIYDNNKYRFFLQENGEKMLDNILEHNLANNSCHVNPCVHTYPSRVTPQDMKEEMRRHNQRALNKYATNKPNNGCAKHTPYRLN